MSSLTVRRISCEDIQLVQNLIERCLQLYMSQKEVIDTLLEQAKIEPGFTELVWQKLEEENREFFKAYYLRLRVKHQIMEYNKLLEQQLHLMRQMQLTGGVSSIPNRNMNQQQLQYIHKDAVQSSHNNLPSAYINGGSVINNTNIIPSSVEFSTHSTRVVNPPPPPPQQNMVSLQTTTTNMPLIQDMIKSETSAAYSNFALPYIYGGETHSAAASFSNESSNQSLNDPFVDAEASTFGVLGQIPRNFSFSDLNASDILESYENLLDSDENVDHQGDDKRLGTISESK